MPILNALPISNEYVKVRWKEPYVSDALNRKFFGIFPKGIYAGMSLSPGNLSGRDILVGINYVSGGIGSGSVSGFVSGAFDETLGLSIAVHANPNGDSTTVQIFPPNNTFHLDATGLDGQKVFVALDVSYMYNQITTAQFILCDSTLLDQDPSLVVLGHVNVPSNPMTPLDASMFSYDDPVYPRLTPMSNPLRAGLMPKEVWKKIFEIDQFVDPGAVAAQVPNTTMVNVFPASGVRVDGTQVRLPIGSQVVNYGGGTIDFASGLIVGGGSSFVGATSLLSPNEDVYYSVQIVPGNPNILFVIPGTPAPTGSAAYASFAPNGIPRAQVLVRKNGGGVVQNIAQTNITMMIASGSGSGAGQGGSDLVRAVWETEQGTYSIPQPNQLLDNFFDSTKGTYVNAGTQNSTLVPSGTFLSYSYERSKLTTDTCTSAQGVSFMRIIAFRPNATLISGNTVTFNDDLTPYFAVNTPTTIIREFTNDGATDHVHLTQPNPASVARLTVASINFALGVTTIVFNNPFGLDITMGGVPQSELRFVPANYQLQASVTGSGNLATMTLKSAHILNIIKINGSGVLGFLSNPFGSMDFMSGDISDNGTYAYVRVYEKTASTDQIAAYYSKDGGNSWTRHATVINQNNTLIDDFNGMFSNGGGRRGSVVVANNGKVIDVYIKYNGTNDNIQGRVIDLSSGSPAFTDLPVTGTDSWNTAHGATPGVVFDGSRYSIVAADRVDLSLIAVAYTTGATDGRVRFYTGGGASYLGVTSTAFSHASDNRLMSLEVSGSSGSHRVTIFTADNASGNLLFYYFDPETAGMAQVGNGTLDTAGGASTVIIDTKSIGNKVYIYYKYNTANPSGWNVDQLYISGNLSTQVYSSPRLLTRFHREDGPNGYAAGGTPSYLLYNTYRQRLVIDPNNTSHILFVGEDFGEDSPSTLYWFITRVVLFEVTDDSNYKGPIVSVPAFTTSINLLDITTNNTKLAEIITASTGDRVRSLAFRAQAGTTTSKFPKGTYSITCSIQNVASGAPNGIVVANALNSYDPHDITTITGSDNGQKLWFQFPDTPLTNGQQYAFVITANYPASNTDFILFLFNNTNPFPSGTMERFVGGSWVTVATSALTFEWNGEWISHVGEAIRGNTGATTSNIDINGEALNDSEPSIYLSDSSTAILVYRRVLAQNKVGGFNQYAGHLRRRTISLSVGSTQSGISAAQVIGYDPTKWDPFLVLNTACGTAICEGRDVTTGLGNGLKAEDRSGCQGGFSQAGNYGSGTTYPADSDFDSGFCANTGSGGVKFWYDDLLCDIGNRKFAIEVEIKPTSFATDFFIISNGVNASTSGWEFILRSTGQLEFSSIDGAFTSLSTNTLSLNTYYKVKATGDGTNIRLFINGVECAYSTQCTTGYAITASAGYVYLGGLYLAGASYFVGRMGLCRMVVGSNTFVSPLFYDQSAMAEPINMGKVIVAEQRQGSALYSDLAESPAGAFDAPVFINLNPIPSSFVNSYDQLWQWSLDFATGGNQLDAKILGQRVSIDDPSSIPAIGWEFFS